MLCGDFNFSDQNYHQTEEGEEEAELQNDVLGTALPEHVDEWHHVHGEGDIGTTMGVCYHTFYEEDEEAKADKEAKTVKPRRYGGAAVCVCVCVCVCACARRYPSVTHHPLTHSLLTLPLTYA